MINADRNYFLKNLISRRQLFPQEAKNKFTRFSPLVYISTSPCPESTIKEIGIKNWPKRTCDESPFNWIYEDKETCLLLEEEVNMTSEGEGSVKFSAGDLVIFPAGMDCRWDVHKVVRKHYRFGD